MMIQAIVIDGFHKGHVVRMEYYPKLKLLKPKSIRVDYCCDMSESPINDEEMAVYKECFRAVDQKLVLYSTTGKSQDVFSMFPHEVSEKPWISNRTYLKFGYHSEPIIREDVTPSNTKGSMEDTMQDAVGK